MSELLTAAQMRAIEQAAIDSGAVTGLELMERAGRGVVEAIFEEWPELQTTSHRAVVLCGPGNNGGDGFVVARLLKEWGWEVEVFLYGDPEKLPPDARTNYERWLALGKVRPFAEADYLVARDTGKPQKADLIVDALFGTGVTRPIPSEIVERLDGEDFFSLGSHGVVAVDAPSGLCLDSGRDFYGGIRMHYGLTVSFQRPKIGHHLAQGTFLCGALRVVDIGLEDILERQRLSTRTSYEVAELVEPVRRHAEASARLPGLPLDKSGDHKYHSGHALILSGPSGKGGAARLAARGALRIGAGLVTLAGPASVQYEHNAQITAIMWREIKGAPGLTELLEDDDRLNALCLGPGMGLGHGTSHMVLAALEAKRPTVLDADALTQFQRDPQVLFDALHENVVLTPHAGEFARLFPDLAEMLDAPTTKGPAYSKVDATREAAARSGCTVLFKGPDTVIASPDIRTRINSAHYDRKAPWLATAGSGDVLSGFITGLLARGFDPLNAASSAAWLHVECARSFGPGLIAEDLPEELPKVFRALGL